MSDNFAIQKALNAWFENQGIKPFDAIVAMLTMVGATIGNGKSTPEELATGLSDANALLLRSALQAWDEKHGKK